MFRAKLIDNVSYYKSKRIQLVLLILPIFPIGLGVNLYFDSLALSLLSLFLYAGILVLIVRNQKQLAEFSGTRSLEIGEEEIVIKKNESGAREVIRVADVDKFMLPANYSIPQDTAGDILDDLGGKPVQNYLTLVQAGEQREFHFEIDSHYMIVQLEKVIQHWRSRGYTLEIAGQVDQAVAA